MEDRDVEKDDDENQNDKAADEVEEDKCRITR